MNLTQMIARVTALALAIMLLNCDALLLVPLIPKIMTPDIGPASQGGLLISIQTLVGACTVLIFAPLSNILGRKQLLLFGAALIAMANVNMGMSTSFSDYVMSRALGGAGGAILLANALTYAGDSFAADKRGRIMGILTAAQAVGAGFGIYVVSALAFRYSLRTAYWTMTGVALLVLVLIAIIIPEPQKKNKFSISMSEYFGKYIKVLSLPSVFFAVLCCALWSGSWHGVWDFNGLYFGNNFKLNVEEVGGILFLSICGYFVGALIGGKVSEMITSKKTLIMAIFFSVVLMNVFANLTAHMIPAIVILVIWTTFLGIGDASVFAMVSGLNDEFRGVILSINSACLFIGISVFTAVTSGLLPIHGIAVIGVLCGGACLLILPLLVFGVRSRF